MQFSAFFLGYTEYLEAYKGYSPRTAGNYRLAYKQFLGFIQARGLTDDVKHFTPDNCQEWVQYLAIEGNKPNSITTKLSALASLGTYGMKTKDGRGKYVLAENPLARIDRPQRQHANRKYLHPREVDALLTVDCKPNERAVLDLLLDTGLRASEVAQANQEHLWRAGDDRLILSVSVKGRGRREQKIDIPLGEKVGEQLLALRAAREASPGDPLLVNQAGHRFSRTDLSEMVARLARRAGIARFAVRAHALRHTYNVIARVEAGLDGPQRAGLLNQSDTASVTKYDHLLPTETIHAREAVRAGLERYRQVGQNKATP